MNPGAYLTKTTSESSSLRKADFTSMWWMHQSFAGADANMRWTDSIHATNATTSKSIPYC